MSTLSKIQLCDKFEKKLSDWKIKFIRPTPYHIQVQKVHNFYPTKRKYHNSETMKVITYPKFKNVNDFLKFVGEQYDDLEQDMLSYTQLLIQRNRLIEMVEKMFDPSVNEFELNLMKNELEDIKNETFKMNNQLNLKL